MFETSFQLQGGWDHWWWPAIAAGASTFSTQTVCYGVLHNVCYTWPPLHSSVPAATTPGKVQERGNMRGTDNLAAKMADFNNATVAHSTQDIAK